ncbi:hypothetical protein [Thiothrix unzii]|jgi:hypothetical protein|uniref:Uncharacterized protein n=1 Tax=Thiothrix unzii TaxID=111769 RepID=A0A975IJ33_9GAMM|nr:hypothetical protein [Thiothrix unzii]QTR55429.1 hypothetical protein J9260_18250 [Thiothrix unzii]
MASTTKTFTISGSVWVNKEWEECLLVDVKANTVKQAMERFATKHKSFFLRHWKFEVHQWNSDKPDYFTFYRDLVSGKFQQENPVTANGV